MCLQQFGGPKWGRRHLLRTLERTKYSDVSLNRRTDINFGTDLLDARADGWYFNLLPIDNRRSGEQADTNDSQCDQGGPHGAVTIGHRMLPFRHRLIGSGVYATALRRSRDCSHCATRFQLAKMRLTRFPE